MFFARKEPLCCTVQVFYEQLSWIIFGFELISVRCRNTDVV